VTKKRFRSGTTLVVATVVIGVLFTVFGIYKLRTWTRPAPSFANLKLSKLTTTEKIVTAAISPDGQHFAYVTIKDDKQALRIRRVAATSGELEIVPSADANYQGLTFSPDGNFIYYVRSTPGETGTIYRIPANGGAITTLYKDVESPVSVSADGKSLAYVRGYPDQKQTAVVIGQEDGKGERIVAVLKDPDEAFVLSSGPAFSPNGRLVAAAAAHNDASGTYQNVLVVSIRDGTVRSIGNSRFLEVGRLFWHLVGGTLVMTAKDQESRGAQVWQLGYPTGELTHITNDSSDYEDVTITRDSHQILAVRNELQASDVVLLRGD
jgi:Tol biopolymer transport system component